MFKLSRFVHIYSDCDIVWHSLRFTRLPLDRQILSALIIEQQSKHTYADWKKILGNWFSTILDAGILVEDTGDDKELRKATSHFGESQIQGLYLLLSLQCNLDCDYCLYRASASQSLVSKTNQQQTMNLLTVKSAIDCFAAATKNNNRHPDYWEQITFYGGEPLLNFDVLVGAVKHVRLLQSDELIWPGVEMVINTNGLLINEKIAHFLADENIEAQLSIDGFQPIHDIHRRTTDQRGSFDSVIRSLQLLIESGVTTRPTITVNEENLDQLPEFVDWLFITYNITSYAINVMMSGTGECKSDYPARAAKAMLAANMTAIKHGASDPNISGLLQAFNGPHVSRPSCGTSRKLTVFPNGQIHTCQALEKSGVAKIGHLPQINLNNTDRKHWLERSRFTNPTCLDCPAIGGCGGGCAAGSFHTSGDINTIDPHQCGWTKTIFEYWLSQHS